jgi:hypothetical protein
MWPKDTKGVLRMCKSMKDRQHNGHIVLSVLHRFTHSDYPFGIFWPRWVVCPSSIYTFWLPLLILLTTLCCLSFIDLHILITPLVSFGHIVLSFLHRFTPSDSPFCIFWPHWVVCPSSIYPFSLPLCYLFATLSCLSFIDLHILITPLVSFGHIELSVLHRFTHSDYPFGIFWCQRGNQNV